MTVRVLGIDPSLRSTGMAILSYDEGEPIRVSHCQTITVPATIKGKDAILQMIDLLSVECEKTADYQNAHQVIIESPPAIFNPKFPSSGLLPVAHISGASVVIFGSHKSFLTYPQEWNKSRKKDKTRDLILEELGDVSNWHLNRKIKSEKLLEHIIDAAGMALWWLKLHHIQDF